MKIIRDFKKYLIRKKLQKIIQPIKTADIMTFAFNTRPTIANKGYDAEGKLFEVDMKSGKVALYKCVEYESGWNVDWGWYYLIFWEFKEGD